VYTITDVESPVRVVLGLPMSAQPAEEDASPPVSMKSQKAGHRYCEGGGGEHDWKQNPKVTENQNNQIRTMAQRTAANIWTNRTL
jgi:hypothetical protein